MKKGIKLLLLLSLFLGSLFLFYKPLTVALCKGGLSFLFSEAEEFSYQKIAWEKEHLTLHGLHVKAKGYDLSVDQIDASFSFVHLDLKVTHPEIVLGDLLTERKKAPSLAPFAFISLQVEHGVLQLQNAPRLYFSLETAKQFHAPSLLSLSYDPEGTPFCLATSKVTKEYIEGELSVAEIPIAWLEPWVTLFSSEYQEVFKEAHGMISLTGRGIFSHQGAPLSLEGNGSVKELRIQTPYDLSLADLSFEFSYLPKDKEPFSWKEVKLDLSLNEGRWQIDPSLSLEDVCGNVRFYEEEPQLALQGFLKKEDKIPFQLEAETFINEELTLACSLGKLSKGRIVIGKERFILKAEVVTAKDVQPFFPKCKEGVFQGSCHLISKEGMFTDLHFEDLNCHHVSVDTFSCKELQGDLTLTCHPAFAVQESALRIKGGAFTYEKYFGKDLDLHLVIKEGLLKPSALTGSLCGWQGKILSDEEELFRFSFTGSFNTLPSLGRVAQVLDQSSTVSGSVFFEADKIDVLGAIQYQEKELHWGCAFAHSQFQEGWLEGLNLDASFYAPLVHSFLPDVSVLGTFDLLTRITPEELKLDISTDGAILSYQNVHLEIPALKQPLSFSYDVKREQWEASFPLENGTLSNKSWKVEEIKLALVMKTGKVEKALWSGTVGQLPLQGELSCQWDPALNQLEGTLLAAFPKESPISYATLEMKYGKEKGISTRMRAYRKQEEIASIGVSTFQGTYQVDPASHLLSIPLNIDQLFLTPDFQFEKIRCTPEIPWAKIPTLVQLAEDLSLFSIDPSFLEQVHALKLKGNLSLYLQGSKTELVFGGKGENFACKGKFQNQLLTLDLLKAGGGNFSGSLFKDKEGNYQIKGAEASFNQFGFVGEAIYQTASKTLIGNGCFSAEEYQGLSFKSGNATSFVYNKETGLQVGQALCDFYAPTSKAHLGKIKVQKILWLLDNVTLSGLNFSLSPTLLPLLHLNLPQQLQPSGYFEGEGDFFYSPQNITFKGSLKEGLYRWDDKEFPLSRISIAYEQGMLGLRFRTLYGADVPLWVETHLSLSGPLYGMIQVSPSLETKGIKALFKTEEGILKWDSIVGDLYGLNVSLLKSKTSVIPKAQVLSGSCEVDFKTFAPLFGKEIARKLKTLQLGSGYGFEGNLVLWNEAKKGWSLTGLLQGKETQCLGYAFKTMQGKIKCQKESIEITDFSFTDPAGTIEMRKIFCSKGPEWNFSIPLFQMKELRPSALTSEEGTAGQMKPFMITQCSLEGIRGKLEDISTWEGQGALHFTNAFKKESSFWDGPLDLLRNLGLDPGLLTPICGDIDLKLCGDKLYLDHLKNSFSEGERSQFFLSVDKGASYIDLDGHIHVDIRMRQEVLLKITERLILTIRGTLEKPKYGIQY